MCARGPFLLMYTTLYTTFLLFFCSPCARNISFCQWHDHQMKSTNLRCRGLRRMCIMWSFCQVLLLHKQSMAIPLPRWKNNQESAFDWHIALPCRRSASLFHLQLCITEAGLWLGVANAYVWYKGPLDTAEVVLRSLMLTLFWRGLEDKRW